MNGKEKAIPFLERFVENLGNLIFGNPLDQGGNIKPLDPRYKGPGFHGLPKHQEEKEYELLRMQGPQAFVPGLGKPGVDQSSIVGLGGPGLNPWGGGEDVKTAGLVGFEDWTGPKEHGPFPDIFKSKNINQKGLKSLMEEMQEYRRRGVL